MEILENTEEIIMTEEIGEETGIEEEEESLNMKENEGTVNGSRDMILGGYNRDRPPEDDCCPICFDCFDIPCKTNCGHWFCSSCILQYWRYSRDIRQCKCPMCGSSVSKLVPLPSLLIQPREKTRKVLEDVNLYNNLNAGGWRGLFRKVLALPQHIRRKSREEIDPPILRRMYRVLRTIGILLACLYEVWDFNFIPDGRRNIIITSEICAAAIYIAFIVDVFWYRWTLRRRARRLAQEGVGL